MTSILRSLRSFAASSLKKRFHPRAFASIPFLVSFPTQAPMPRTKPSPQIAGEEKPVPKTRRLKPKHWVRIIVLGIIALLIWVPVQRVLDIAAVQNSVQRDWEMSFNSPNMKPDMLPSFLDSWADSLFKRIFKDTVGANGTEPAQTRNRDIIYQERFRSLFRGPIRDFRIYEFLEFHGDLGSELARFQNLRRVMVENNDYSNLPTESEWTLLCTRLRTLPHLEEVTLGGVSVTDAAIAPLAGHPELQTIEISSGHLTLESNKTFASMPRLSKLVIGRHVMYREVWLRPENQAMQRAALPAVSIEFQSTKGQ
jgi:hypothetical protein